MFPHLSCRQWRDLAQGLVDSALRDQLARLCNTLVRFFAKAVLDPNVWKTTRDWAAFKKKALDEVAFPFVQTVDIHDSLADCLYLALSAILGVSGWRLGELRQLTLYIVDEVAQRAHSVLTDIMLTQSSIPRGFMSDYTVRPEVLREMVYLTATVLHGRLCWPVVSKDWSGLQVTELMQKLLAAGRPAALWDLKSGDLSDFPVEPFQYVYTEGWKHDNKSGPRGVFATHRRMTQPVESHKLRLLIKLSLADPVPASGPVAPGAAPAAPSGVEPDPVPAPGPVAAPPAAPADCTASTKRKSVWECQVGKRSFPT